MEFVSRIALEINGGVEDSFKGFTEKAFTLAKPVNLMYTTGVMKVTPRYQMELDYLIPLNEQEMDWESVEDGTLTIEKEDGKRITFTGVNILEVGDVKYDGDNEAVRPITFMAETREDESF